MSTFESGRLSVAFSCLGLCIGSMLIGVVAWPSRLVGQIGRPTSDVVLQGTKYVVCRIQVNITASKEELQKYGLTADGIKSSFGHGTLVRISARTGEKIDTVIHDPKTKGYWATRGEALFPIDLQTGEDLPNPDGPLTEAVANLQKRAMLADVSLDPLKAASLLLEVGQKDWAELIRSAALAGQIKAAGDLKVEDAFLLATKTNFDSRKR